MPCNVPSISFKILSGNPVKDATGRLKLFAKNGALYTIDSSGNVTLINPGPALATIQALEPIAADQMLYTNGVNQFNVSPITLLARQLLDDASQGVMQSTLGLVIGTNVQAHSSVLDDTAANVTWIGANATFSGQLTGASLFATGNLTANGDLQVDTNANIDGTLTVNDQVQLNGLVTFNSDAAMQTMAATTLTAGVIGVGPTITSGAAVPTGTDPDGSLYLRTGAPNGSLYVRQNGAWVGPK